MAVSLLLHLAVLTLQFGVPGQGQPSSGWLWGARSVSASASLSAPVANLRAELQAAPVETRAAPASVLPTRDALARTTTAPPTLNEPGAPKTGFQVRHLSAPPKKQLAPVLSAPPRSHSRRHDRSGTPVLSVKKKPNPEDWRIEASEGAEGKLEKGHLPRVTAQTPPQPEPLPEPLLPEPPLPEPPAEVKKIELAAAEVPLPLPVAQTAEPLPKPPSPDLAAMEAAQKQRQAAERAEAERAAAQALKQQEEAEARARVQADEARRKAERAALARLADEEAKLAQAQHQQAEARAEENRLRALAEAQQLQEARERTQARAREQAREQARLEAEQLAARQKAEQAAAEQRRQAQLAAEQAAAQAAAQAAKEAARQQALAQERAAAQAEAGGRRGEPAVLSATLPAGGSGGADKGASRGRSLAEQAMALARSGLPMKPPVDTESLAQGARRAFLGRNPAEVQLSFYNDSWVQKVERLSRVNYPKLSRHRAYGSLVVSVTIRSDGSLVGVHVLKSSGSREVDEAARRLLEMSAPFAAFPPDLRRVYDTLEITRTLSFPEQPPMIVSQ